MRNRYSSRPTLDVADEYDVQDLLHSLLILDFEDIRTEGSIPSYSGVTKKQSTKTVQHLSGRSALKISTTLLGTTNEGRAIDCCRR